MCEERRRDEVQNKLFYYSRHNSCKRRQHCYQAVYKAQAMTMTLTRVKNKFRNQMVRDA